MEVPHHVACRHSELSLNPEPHKNLCCMSSASCPQQTFKYLLGMSVHAQTWKMTQRPLTTHAILLRLSLKQKKNSHENCRRSHAAGNFHGFALT